jgi:hypothetical protein
LVLQTKQILFKGQKIDPEMSEEEDPISEDELIFTTIKSLEMILERYSQTKRSSTPQQDSHRGAFAAALRKFAHFLDDPPTEETREPYPTKWLRQQFVGPTTRSSDNWLPLHWILCDEAPKVELVQSLLEETGHEAFTEDVSPLSIAVAQRNPTASIINAIINYKPMSVSTPDKDGAMAMMYASAWNDTEMVVHMLWKHCPEAMSTIDKYNYRLFLSSIQIFNSFSYEGMDITRFITLHMLEVKMLFHT